MAEWRTRLLSAAGHLATAVLLAALAAVVVQGWREEQSSRFVTSGGLAAVVALLALFRRRLAAWSRAHLVFTGAVVSIGVLALYRADAPASDLAVGPVTLPFLVNLLILAALALAVAVTWRIPRLPRWARLAVTVLALLLSHPYARGALRGLSLRDLVQGEGIPIALPVYLQPAVLAAGVFLPLLVVFLLVDLVRAIRSAERSSLRGVLSLLCGLVPVTVFAVTVLGQQSAGAVVRVFQGHSYQNLHETRTDAGLSLSWDEPPAEGEEAAFWVEWEGRLRVARKGIHQFRMEGPGQGFVYLDGRLVVPMGQSHGEIELAPGEHRLRAASVQDQPAGEFALSWKHREDAEWAPVDSRVLTHQPAQLEWRRSPRQAAQVGIDWLQSEAVGWQRRSNCFGCHVQAQVLMGLSVAQQNDYQVNPDYFQELESFTRAQQAEDGHFHDAYFVTATQYGGMALAYANRWHGDDEDPNVARAADWLLSRQEAAGSFPIDHVNPPIDQGNVTVTSNSVMTLMRAHENTEEARYREAAERGLDWIALAEGELTQDHALAILALASHGGPARRAALDAHLARLRGEQQPDGGWKEHPAMPGSNPYATGQALYAFKQAGVSVNDPAFRKGVLYLLDTQKVSGSWAARNTQSGSKTEFAPTMWAVIGLAGSFGAVIPELVGAGECRGVSGALPLEARVANFTESEIASVAFRVDDGAPIPATQQAGTDLWQASWNSELAPDGAHTLRVAATSASGEKGADSTVVHTGGPLSIAIRNPTAGEVLSAAIDCVAELSNPAELPLQQVELRLDGEPIGSFDAPPFRAPCDFAALPDGAHTVAAVARSCGVEVADEIQVAVGPDQGPGKLQVRLRTEGGEQVLYIPPAQIELVLDLSGSMWGRIEGRPKYQIALRVLDSVFRDLPPDARVALRAYGHRREGDCEDSELVIPPAPVDPAAIAERVNRLRPVGKTPIGHSLRLALEDLRKAEGRKAVILLSDGIETCEGDPVAAARELVEAGLGFRVHVVGFDIGDAPEAVAQLREVAEVGGGRFLLAQNANQLSDAMKEAVQVGYSITDEKGVVIHRGSLGPERIELMSGSYRIEVDLEPPLVLKPMVIDRGATTRVEVVRDGKRFRIEQSREDPEAS